PYTTLFRSGTYQSCSTSPTSTGNLGDRLKASLAVTPPDYTRTLLPTEELTANTAQLSGVARPAPATLLDTSPRRNPAPTTRTSGGPRRSRRHRRTPSAGARCAGPRSASQRPRRRPAREPGPLPAALPAADRGSTRSARMLTRGPRAARSSAHRARGHDGALPSQA